MKRRGFLAALAAVPFLGRLVAPPRRQTFKVGQYNACFFEVGQLPDWFHAEGLYDVDALLPGCLGRGMVVSGVDYEAGTVTVTDPRPNVPRAKIEGLSAWLPDADAHPYWTEEDMRRS